MFHYGREHVRLGFCSIPFYQLNLELQSKGPKSQETEAVPLSLLINIEELNEEIPKVATIAWTIHEGRELSHIKRSESFRFSPT